MQFGAVRLFLIVIVLGLVPASGFAQDVTGSETPSETTTPITDDSAGTAGTIGTTLLETLGDVSNVTSPTDANGQTENQTETNSHQPTLTITVESSNHTPVANNSESTPMQTDSQPTDLASPETTINQQETTVTTPNTTIQPTTTVRATTTVENNMIPEMIFNVSTNETFNSTTIAPTNESTISSTVGPTIRPTTTNGLPTNESTSSSTVGPTIRPTTSEKPATTTERQMTTNSTATTTTKITTTTTTTTTQRSPTTTQPFHECVTSAPCVDPNAHCVNQGGRNTCQCRVGFQKNSTSGRCLSIISSTTSSPLELGNATSPSSFPSTPSEPIPVPSKKNMVRRASELNKYEKRDVVSMSLLPATSVVEWLLEKDLPFREAIARILTSTNFTLIEESEKSKTVNVTAEQVLYVVPSPQLTADGLLVSFLVQDKEGVTPRHHSPLGGVIARHKRDANASENITTGYLPSVWIISALRNRQHTLEVALNQTISSLYGGIIPQQLYSLEQIASASLFERRLDIFIPLILVAAVCFMGLAVSLVCIRAKTRSMATWDPPAGVVFGKTSIKKENREDPLGSTDKRESIGHHLATDEQCRDGEEQLMKHSTHIHQDDDVWVVPYDDAPAQHGQPSHLKTQYEDTKL